MKNNEIKEEIFLDKADLPVVVFKLRPEEEKRKRTRNEKSIGRDDSTCEGTESKESLAYLFGELFVWGCSRGCDG